MGSEFSDWIKPTGGIKCSMVKKSPTRAQGFLLVSVLLELDMKMVQDQALAGVSEYRRMLPYDKSY